MKSCSSVILFAVIVAACSFGEKPEKKTDDSKKWDCAELFADNKRLREEIDRLRAYSGIPPLDQQPDQHGGETVEQKKKRCSYKIGAGC